MFVNVFSICMTLSLQYLTTFSFTGPKIVVFTYSKNFGKFLHAILNKRQLSTYTFSVSDSIIASHASMTALHISLGGSIHFEIYNPQNVKYISH